MGISHTDANLNITSDIYIVNKIPCTIGVVQGLGVGPERISIMSVLTQA